jgi:hypothetical protein
MIVRRFTESGIAAFKKFLAECRENPAATVPTELLDDDTYSVVLSPAMEVESRHFGSRREAAVYFASVLASLPEREIAENAGLWTWLTLFYFDDVCPVRKGKRMVKNDYHYVFEPKNQRHFYRHLLFLAWRVVKLSPMHNRLFLDRPLATLDKVTSEVFKRLYMTRIPCIFEALDTLYWDETISRARTGMVSPGTVKPGDLMHRLPIRIRQLERTYDLVSLTADDLIDLLGAEFKHGHKDTAEPRPAAMAS